MQSNRKAGYMKRKIRYWVVSLDTVSNDEVIDFIIAEIAGLLNLLEEDDD